MSGMQQHNECASAVMRTPAENLTAVEDAMTAKANMPLVRAFALAVLAGVFVATGGSFMIAVRSDATLGSTASAVIGGLAFCFGLFAVMAAGAELFTGNSLMAIGVLRGRFSMGRMLKMWAVVYAGNLVGSLLMVALIYCSGCLGLFGGAFAQTAYNVAVGKASLVPLEAFVRGILCNYLVCLAVWIGSAGKTTCDKLAATILPVTAFVVLGCEHSVANLFFLPLGLAIQGLFGAVAPAMGLAALCQGVLVNIVIVTLGNVVGGVAFGAMYWVAFGRE